MKTIHKYPLDVVDSQEVIMPTNSRILTVQVQQDTPCLWAEVDTTLESTARVIVTRGTGHPLSENMVYLGSYQLREGALVFHVLELV